MIEAALDSLALPAHMGVDSTHKPFWTTLNHSSGMGRAAWWDLLDGLEGEAGRELLSCIVLELETDPQRFRAMNPSNEWGSYEELLGIMREMRDTVGSSGERWSVSG